MSNKSPQELDEILSRYGQSCIDWSHKAGGSEEYSLEDAKRDIHSHMQAGFDEICTVIRDTKQGTSLETLEDNVKLRAAEWLLGSKENG